ncbi:MAG TPA: glutamine amidotransferase [Gammaproteobacteria bacterium]
MFEFLFKYSPATFENGEFLFASGWPLWLLIALTILGTAGLCVSLLQRRESLGLFKLSVLAGLQAAMLGVLLVLLWQPALSTEQLRSRDNAVAVVVDTSASMSYGDGERSRLQQAVAALNDDVLGELDASLDVRLYAFADASMAIDSFEELPPPGRATHIGDAILGVLREAGSSALSAVILVSDGADTSAQLGPERMAEIAAFGVPIHTVGAGREVIPEDIELAGVRMATEVMPGSRINAQVSIRHAVAGQAQLKVYDGDAILASESLTLPERNGTSTYWVDFDIGEAGMKDLRFVLDALPGERNTVNNAQYRVIEIPETRRSVLYLEGEPRWEYKFIRRALPEDSPIRLASLLRTTPNKFYRQGLDEPTELENGAPADKETLFAYDALIIGSYEAAAFTPEQQQAIQDFVSVRGGSLLMLGGLRGLSDGGWGNSPVAEVLPVALPAIDAASFIRWRAKARLTDDGRESLITQLDSDPGANSEAWQGMPELADFQYLAELKPGAVALLEAEIQDTVHPLLVHQRYGLGNAYVLATGGTWRWQMQLSSEDMRHETFWRQLLHALVSGVPSPVRLTADRFYYGDETEVRLRAEVRDRKFEPVSDGTVSLTVSGGDGEPAEVAMQPVPGEPGSYAATVQAENVGIYEFSVEASLAEEPLGSAMFAIRREDGVAEHFAIQQNRPLLERLAGLTGGRYFRLDELAGLPEQIRFSQAGIVETQVLPLWNMPVNFLLLLLLKAGEWLLRLFWGRL